MSGHKRYYTMKEVAEYVELPVEQAEALVRQSGLFTASRSGLKYFYQHADLLAIRRFALQQQAPIEDQSNVNVAAIRPNDELKNDPFGLLAASQTDDRCADFAQEPDFVDVLGMIADDSPHPQMETPVDAMRHVCVQDNEGFSNDVHRYSAAAEPPFTYHEVDNLELESSAALSHSSVHEQDEIHDEVLSLPSKWVDVHEVRHAGMGSESNQDLTKLIQSLRDQNHQLKHDHQAIRQKEREALRQEVLSIAALLRS